MIETLFELDQVRNSAIAMAEKYHKKSTDNATFDLLQSTKSALGCMVLFSRDVAPRLAEKQKELCRYTRLSSTHGEILPKGNLDLKAGLGYAKSQKKDSYFGTRIHISLAA